MAKSNFDPETKNMPSSDALSSPLLDENAGEVVRIIVKEEDNPGLSESKDATVDKFLMLKNALKIGADYIEIGLEAAFWQMIADQIDNYYNVHPDDSYFNHYSPTAYLLRATCVGSIQGLTTAGYSLIVDQDLMQALKKGTASFAAGFIWQPLADLAPLNNPNSTTSQIMINNLIVGTGTGITLCLAKNVLHMPKEDMPVFTSAMGAVGFSDAYPVPTPEPKGVRGALGAALGTILGTAAGNALTKVGIFCFNRVKGVKAEEKAAPTPVNESKLEPK